MTSIMTILALRNLQFEPAPEKITFAARCTVCKGVSQYRDTRDKVLLVLNGDVQIKCLRCGGIHVMEAAPLDDHTHHVPE